MIFRHTVDQYSIDVHTVDRLTDLLRVDVHFLASQATGHPMTLIGGPYREPRMDAPGEIWSWEYEPSPWLSDSVTMTH